jgi:hypothetical protein
VRRDETGKIIEQVNETDRCLSSIARCSQSIDVDNNNNNDDDDENNNEKNLQVDGDSTSPIEHIVER